MLNLESNMHNQQSVLIRLTELETEINKIKTQIQKEPMPSKGFVWGKINFLDSQIEDAKGAIFDFDIDQYVTRKDIASWK